MRTDCWIRVILLGILIGVLVVPPEALQASVQQEGPIKPSPPQPPGPPPPPQEKTGPQQQGQPQEQQPGYQISVQTNLVNVDAVVTDQDGNLITGLKKENFRIFDNNQPQIVSNFAPTEAPITIVMLMEFSGLVYGFFAYTAKYWSYDFLNHLNQQDWVALKTFDLKTHLDADFTQNKSEVQDAIRSLYFPGFHEANLFDAVIETLDQLKDVKGKKSILLLATGFDTFSKHNLDQTLKRLKETDVTIFCVGVAEQLLVRTVGYGGINYLQAKNQLETFGRLTGGFAWSPRFDGELPSIFRSVVAMLRNQYTVGFTPTTPPDGKYHKLKVEIVDEQGSPLFVTDKKGKKRKIVVYAREGYVSPTAAVSD